MQNKFAMNVWFNNVYAIVLKQPHSKKRFLYFFFDRCLEDNLWNQQDKLWEAEGTQEDKVWPGPWN